MDVQLYVYDLSRGLARTMSMQFLGIQIDAVYHTSIVFDGIEYFFGAGVQTCRAGGSHHGQPMEIIALGKTSLPIEIILEYLESLKEIYKAEAYDLFLHNCNNFSNDFAMFLVGKPIPEHITSLPQTVLNTPFGRMLKPQIDAAMRPITQAPVAPGPSRSAAASQATRAAIASAGKVHNVSSAQEVDRLLDSAKDSCAIIFFTSSTCGPCKLVYQPYDDLAVEAGSRCVFIKIDFTHADGSIGQKFPNVRATPTFVTFLHGQKRDEWSGADARQLRNNVELLLNAAYPPHPHLLKSMPTFLRYSQRPITYTKVPPLDKVVAKMGGSGQDPAVEKIVSFIKTRESSGAIEAPLTSLPQFATFLRRSTSLLPPDLLFTALDLLRVSLTDVRVAGFFAETSGTIAHLLDHVNSLGTDAPYSLRLTTLHMSCNLFTSSLFIPHLLSHPLSSALVSLVTTALLDEKHPALRVSALSLAMNMACSNHKIRMKAHGATSAVSGSELDESEQVELLASLLEILGKDGGWDDGKKMALLCIGWLGYCAPMEGELLGLCTVMDAGETVEKLSEGIKGVEDRMLAREIKELLKG